MPPVPQPKNHQVEINDSVTVSDVIVPTLTSGQTNPPNDPPNITRRKAVKIRFA
jgi:hypothetical protein